MAKISFVIPIYNIEKYLRRCLDSISNQTESDFEAILVDDGSTDHSGDICNEYTKSDSRFTYQYQQNAWVAAARNKGLAAVKSGEYISFIDPDDYIDPDFVKTLYAHAKENRADILSFGHKKNDADGVVNEAPICRIVEPKEDTLLGHFCKDWLHTPRQNYVWSKLYRREFLDSTKANFSGKLRASEDRNFLYKVLYQSKRTVYVTESPYFYYQHEESMTRSIASEEKFFKGYLESYIDICEYWEKIGFHAFDPVKPMILYHALRSVFFHVNRHLGNMESVAEVAVQALRDFPLNEEFNRNRLKSAIKIYSDMCGLNQKDCFEIETFINSLLEGKKAIITWQEGQIYR